LTATRNEIILKELQSIDEADNIGRRQAAIDPTYCFSNPIICDRQQGEQI